MKPQMHTDTHRLPEMKPPMDADGRRLSLDELTEKVIGCAFTVSNALGCGFLEKVYENALVHEVRKQGLEIWQQSPIPVRYDGIVVGDYIADLIIEQKLLVEIKAARGIDEVHHAQCINYLKATGYKACLLMNFARPKVEIKRIVHRF